MAAPEWCCAGGAVELALRVPPVSSSVDAVLGEPATPIILDTQEDEAPWSGEGRRVAAL